jgi:hypothetical protein
VPASDVLGFSCALLPPDHLRFFSLVRSGKEHRGVDPISGVLPFGRLWYGESISLIPKWYLVTLIASPS